MKVTAKGGTLIAFDRSGGGPPVIMVDGASCYRTSGPSGASATLQTKHFTVDTYGGGQSTVQAAY